MSQPRILYRHGQPISAEVLGLLGTRTASGGVQNAIWPGPTELRSLPASPGAVHLVSSSADDCATTPEVPAVPETDVVTLSGTPVVEADATFDEYTIALGGDAPEAGDTFTVTVDETDYVSDPYVAGASIDSIFADLMAKLAEDAYYQPDVSDPMGLKAVTAGVFAHAVTVSTTSATATIAATHTRTGAAAVSASVASITDGTHTYNATYVGGGLTALALALAQVIDGQNGYSAYADSENCVVSGPDGFTFTDDSSGGVEAAFDPTAGSAATPAVTFPGARSVLLTYLDGDGYKRQEVIPLNGDTSVTSVATDVAAVLSLALAEVGSAGAAAGDIICSDTGDSVVYEFIATGANCSASVATTVPSGRSLFIDRAVFSPGNATLGRVRVVATARPGDAAPGFASTVIDQYVSQVVLLDLLDAPIGPFPPGTQLSATVEGDGAIVAVDLLCHLES